jgi:hypothetical protein
MKRTNTFEVRPLPESDETLLQEDMDAPALLTPHAIQKY